MSRATRTKRIPTHPGEVLLEEFLVPLEITQVELAAHIGVPVQRVNEIVRGKRGVTCASRKPHPRTHVEQIRHCEGLQGERVLGFLTASRAGSPRRGVLPSDRERTAGVGG